jgi:membrane-associated HD superfamily phosphohydrolase
MDFSLSKIFRRKKNVSRNERAEKYSSKFILKRDFSKGLGPRLTLVVIFVVCAVFLLPPTQRTKEVDFKAGDIADRDIIAPFNFKVPLSNQELELQEAQASLRVPPVFVRDRQVEYDLTRDLEVLLDTVSTIIAVDTLAEEEKVKLIGAWLPNLSNNTLRVAVSAQNLSAVSRETTRR